MTDARTLGMKDEEIAPLNRDQRPAAKKVRRIYNLILRSPEDKFLQAAFLDALLDWRDAVSNAEGANMTLQDLINETLVEKNCRLQQEKCKHEEVWSSTVRGPDGTFTNSFCLDCGKSLHDARF